MRYLELLEHLHYQTILVEAGRLDFLLKTYGQKLEKKWETAKATEPANITGEVENEPAETIAQKLISFLVSHDPTRNQKYSQWLVNRYLQGGLKLEDAERAARYLEVFDRAKGRLAKKDINAYRSAGELFDAVRPFIEQNVAVSSKEEQSREARRMHQEDQAEIVYDDAEMKIVIPKTEEASCYFGRNTEWCTASTTSHNYFDHYNSRGPLYIVLLKRHNRRYQWHFEDRTFMDEHDRPMRDPTFAEFIRAHPKLIKIIGEERFIPAIRLIGLRFFSPRTINKMDSATLASLIADKDDYEALPEETRRSRDFVIQLLYQNHLALQFVPQDLYDEEILLALIARRPHAFAYLPTNRKTVELAEIAAKDLGSTAIEEHIPRKLWTDSIAQHYWDHKILDSAVKLSDVPPKYRTVTVYWRRVERHPEQVVEIPDDVLTPDFAEKLVARRYAVAPHLPGRVITPKILKAAYENGQGAYDEQRYEYYSPLFKVPLDRFPRDLIKNVMGMRDKSGTSLVTWQKLPEDSRTDPEILVEFIRTHKDEIDKIEDRYLSREVLEQVVRWDNIEKFDPALFDDDFLVRLVEKEIMPEYLYDSFPKKLISPAVMDAFVARSVVPIFEIPQRLRTPENILARMGTFFTAGRLASREEETPKREMAAIPASMWTEEFAAKVVETNHQLVRYVPEKVKTEPVLHSYLVRHRNEHYSGRAEEEGKKVFSKFDTSHWSPRTTTMALFKGWIEPKVSGIPDHLLTPDVASAILTRNPDELSELPPKLAHSSTVLAPAVERNLDLLAEIPARDIDEEVTQAALTHSHGARYSDAEQEVKTAFARLDRSKWSERNWQAAVGYVADLRDVPAKYRKPDLVKDAIIRDASNVTMLKDAAGYLSKHDIIISQNDELLKNRLENNGLIFGKKGYQNAKDLEKKPLSAGGYYAVLPTGRVHRQLYVFDRRGRIVARLVSKRDTIQLATDDRTAMPHRAAVCEAANAAMGQFYAGDLNGLYIYDNRQRTEPSFLLEEEMPRRTHDGIEWTETKHGSGTHYTAWVNNKPILRLRSEPSGGWGRRSTLRLQSVKVLDKPQAVRNANKLFTFIRSNVEDGYAGNLETIGILTNRKGERSLLADKRIASFGDLSVFVSSDGKNIGIFGKNGLVARAMIRANGTIEKVQIEDHRLDSVVSTVQEIFSKMENRLIELRKGKKKKPK